MPQTTSKPSAGAATTSRRRGKAGSAARRDQDGGGRVGTADEITTTLSHRGRARRPGKSSPALQDSVSDAAGDPKPDLGGRPGSWDELTDLLWEAARKGNVPAMRILRDEMKAEAPEKSKRSVIDELASRRAAVRSG
jgi:hypothetical protein